MLEHVGSISLAKSVETPRLLAATEARMPIPRAPQLSKVATASTSEHLQSRDNIEPEPLKRCRRYVALVAGIFETSFGV
ncbi:hypothetical protein PRIC1_006155 [Phytophthora ramorum]